MKFETRKLKNTKPGIAYNFKEGTGHYLTKIDRLFYTEKNVYFKRLSDLPASLE